MSAEPSPSVESSQGHVEAAPDPQVQRQGWEQHPIDIRLSIPMTGKRFFLTLVAGMEKRGWSRRRDDQLRYPLGKRNNMLFFLGAAAVLYLVGAILVFLLPVPW